MRERLTLPSDFRSETMREAESVTDLTLILPDRVGSLAEALGYLAGAGVNVLGHGGFPAWAGEGILHLVVDDVARTVHALTEARIEVREQREVVVVEVRDVPGSLASVFERIAGAGVNIDLTYSLADQRVVIGVNYVERALASLND